MTTYDGDFAICINNNLHDFQAKPGRIFTMSVTRNVLEVNSLTSLDINVTLTNPIKKNSYI